MKPSTFLLGVLGVLIALFTAWDPESSSRAALIDTAPATAAAPDTALVLTRGPHTTRAISKKVLSPPAVVSRPQAPSAPSTWSTIMPADAGMGEPMRRMVRVGSDAERSARLLARLDAETLDVEWTHNSRVLLLDMIAEANLQPDALGEVACGESLCRMQLRLPDMASAAKLRSLSFHDQASVDTFIEDDGDKLSLTVYASRAEDVLEDSYRPMAALDGR